MPGRVSRIGPGSLRLTVIMFGAYAAMGRAGLAV